MYQAQIAGAWQGDDAFAAVTRRPEWQMSAQRVADIVLSCAILLAAAPVLLAVLLAVWLQDGGPPIYRQRRIGQGGRPFDCLKFRSMVLDSDARLKRLLDSDPAARAEWERDHKLRNDPRITLLGRVLRKLSLDELPQLVNVIRGEMALIGPRPIVAAEVSRYGRYFVYYASVRPGLTGLWQISGRSSTTYRRRVAADYLYVRRRTFGLKARIFFGTIPAVLFARGSA
ncbi:sugar transferase [Phenylobacterium sp. VNQ135]|uniref:sugar transferase n=1 Tax=Phenylobacterium sp. VNQ135 TaxID=3400922 RepID=UPI003BFD55AC